MRILKTMLGACATLVALPVAAQHAPDAGQSLRQLQEVPLQPAPERKLDLQLPNSDGAAEAALPTEGGSVRVSGFTLRGNTAESTDQLLALLADLRERTLSLSDLQAAAARITRHYRRLGYPLARAYLPAQTIDDGMVSIVVLEGHYGKIKVDNQAGMRGLDWSPLARLDEGAPVRAEALERALLLMNERAGVRSHAVLRPGSEVGQTDLMVGLDSTPLISGRLGADNGGNRYTGANRLSAGLVANSPLGLGDRLSFQSLGSNIGQLYYSVDYQIPLGPWGTSLGAAYSYMEYQLGKDFSDLDAHGTSNNASVFVSQPLVVSRAFWLGSRLQYEHKRLVDKVDLFDLTSPKRTEVLSLSLDGNARDNLFGGGVTGFSLTWRHGRLSIQGDADKAQDAASARSEGGYDVLAPAVVRLQRLTDKASLFLRWRGQWASKNLDGSEDFGLGGMNGVRAYPQGEALGDEGWVGNLEFRYALTQELQLSAFYDTGHVRANKRAWDDDSRQRRNLGGAGIGASWARDRWRVDVMAAWRTEGGTPQSDSQDNNPCVWLQAGVVF